MADTWNSGVSMSGDVTPTQAWTEQSGGGSSHYGRVAELLGWYMTGAILLLGVPSNLLSFITMLQPSMRGQPTSFYLACLAVFDTGGIIFIALQFWKHTEPYCHVNGMLLSATVTCSGLIILLVTIERLIAVWWPHKVSVWMSPMRAKILVILAVLVSFALFLPRVIHASDTEYCDPVEGYQKAYFIKLTVFYSLGPILLLVILNIAIIVKLHMRSRALPETKYGEIRWITANVVAVSLAYIILTFPSLVSLLYQRITKHPLSSDPGLLWLLNVIFYHLVMLNHSINFWLYVVVLAKFRRALKAMLTCASCRGGQDTDNEMSLVEQTAVPTADISSVDKVTKDHQNETD